MRHARTLTILAVAVGMIAILARAGDLRFNLSPSLPVGLYRVVKSPLIRGSMVLVCLPPHVALIAKARGYLVAGDCPGSVEPLGKVVAAVAPDTVDVTDEGVRINQYLVPNSKPLSQDRRGRLLTWWRGGPAALKPDQVFLLATLRPLSFDSRYFGPVSMNEVRSVIRALPIAQ